MASRRGPDNSVRIAVQGTINGQNWANVFYAQLTTSSAIAQADLDTWTTAFAAAFKTRFAARQNANCAYSLAKAILYTPGGGELISQANMTGTGSASGSLSDNAASEVISWASTVYWRGGKPRTYLTGPGGSVVATGNQLNSTEITALTSAAGSFRTDINALTAGTITGTTFGFLSFRTGNADRPVPLFFSIVGAKVHPRLGTQRRRLGKWLN